METATENELQCHITVPPPDCKHRCYCGLEPDLLSMTRVFEDGLHTHNVTAQHFIVFCEYCGFVECYELYTNRDGKQCGVWL